ncbi:MAG: hypothetical protein KKI09_15410 [Spirochaetes bacterium]|nr:hypothetical protein [Spirochaetota bacterium]MBU0956808.1 hypothetical protein [Spirochaetota bacterium]
MTINQELLQLVAYTVRLNARDFLSRRENAPRVLLLLWLLLAGWLILRYQDNIFNDLERSASGSNSPAFMLMLTIALCYLVYIFISKAIMNRRLQNFAVLFDHIPVSPGRLQQSHRLYCVLKTTAATLLYLPFLLQAGGLLYSLALYSIASLLAVVSSTTAYRIKTPAKRYIQYRPALWAQLLLLCGGYGAILSYLLLVLLFVGFWAIRFGNDTDTRWLAGSLALNLALLDTIIAINALSGSESSRSWNNGRFFLAYPLRFRRWQTWYSFEAFLFLLLPRAAAISAVFLLGGDWGRLIGVYLANAALIPLLFSPGTKLTLVYISLLLGSVFVFAIGFSAGAAAWPILAALGLWSAHSDYGMLPYASKTTATQEKTYAAL